MPAGQDRLRDAARHRQGDGRFHAELRRQGVRARGPADARSQPAGQWLLGHRGGHGDQHPAAQPRRSGRRLPARARPAALRHRGSDQADAGARFPDRRHHLRPRRRARGLPHHHAEVGRGDRQAVIVDELPYQVNKKALLERIAELVTEKKLEGVSDIRDESDRSGMRVVIELKRAEIPEVVLNNLFKQTQLQDSFGINMVALVDGQPRLLSVKELIEAFISHRREVATRRTVYDLRKARERGHVLEGLAVALSNVDEVIDLIKKAATPADAKRELMSRSWRSPLVGEMLHKATPQQFRPEGLPESFGMKDDGYHLSDEQAQAILELRLQRLTGLERDKIRDEYREVIENIVDLLDILAKPSRIMAIIAEELKKIKEEFGDARRSEIVTVAEDIAIEDLIAPQDMVVTFSHGGYVKSQPLADYRAQRRGGRGQ